MPEDDKRLTRDREDALPSLARLTRTIRKIEETQAPLRRAIERIGLSSSRPRRPIVFPGPSGDFEMPHAETNRLLKELLTAQSASNQGAAVTAPAIAAQPEPRATQPSPRVFVSHSSKDKEAAEALVDLLTKALRLASADVRCSSVDGHGFEGGENFDEAVRRDVGSGDVLVALLSPASLASFYVVMELGGWWVTKKPWKPVLLAGTNAAVLKEPLSRFKALHADVEAEVLQLVRELGQILGISPEPPEAILRAVKRVAEAAPADETPEPAVPPEEKALDDLAIRILVLLVESHDPKVPKSRVFGVGGLPHYRIQHAIDVLKDRDLITAWMAASHGTYAYSATKLGRALAIERGLVK